MQTENDTTVRQPRKIRREWLGGLGVEWVLQLALFCAVVTAMTQTIASLGNGTIA